MPLSCQRWQCVCQKSGPCRVFVFIAFARSSRCSDSCQSGLSRIEGGEIGAYALVANRACTPVSKLYCHEQWLKEDVHIAGTQELKLHQLYRAMDFLEANKGAIEQAIFYRVADLLSLDVEVVFYDTTSLHFEIDEEDSGDEEGNVQGSQAAGKKSYAAPRKRGHSKNGRSDAPQIVVGLAVTRDGFPVRHWVFPGNTVDVTTVAKVKEDLRGWQLSRWT